jgi:hypothetical protein
MTILATSPASSARTTTAATTASAAPGNTATLVGPAPVSFGSVAPVTAVRVAGVDGVWALRAWEAPGGRRYELRIADELGIAGMAAVMTMLPDGLRFVRSGVAADDHLATGRPELTLEFSRPLVP